uniref:Sushi domain-containing protein n=1 Tax=Sphaeramia orbicularis TaxID=375764 RepID=A0A673AX38_9TELE
MDSGSLPVRWCVKPSFIMVCLLWTVRCSYGDKNNCPCPEIPHLELTEPPTRGCYNISNTFRYKCIDGYVRKAGTSNLVKCKEDQGSVAWTTPKLACIPDPQRITTPSNTPETAPSSTEQMTQSTTISASVSAQTDNMELTSPGLQVPSDYTQGTKLTEHILFVFVIYSPHNHKLQVCVTSDDYLGNHAQSQLISVSCLFHIHS